MVWVGGITTRGRKINFRVWGLGIRNLKLSIDLQIIIEVRIRKEIRIFLCMPYMDKDYFESLEAC